MFRIASWIVVASLLSLTACSSIRVVHRTSGGGTVALNGPQDGARDKADTYMRAQCPSGYEIVEEGEAVVGQETAARTQETLLGPVTTAQTTDTREWRLTYRCNGAPQASLRSVILSY